MNIFKLAWKYIISRPLSTFLNIILFSLGIAIIVSLLLFSSQSENKLESHIKGVDLVIGAKGSPMQIILCNLFHIDFPTGNIPVREAEKLVGTRFVKTAIPMALGDSYGGYRIIGTTEEYLKLFNAELLEGKLWKKDLEAVVGYRAAQNLGLELGDTFHSQHGMGKEGGAHEHSDFVVTGILKSMGTVHDNLIFTAVPSIWVVHGGHEEKTKPDSLVYSKLLPEVPLAPDHNREITSLLVQFRNPMAALQLPRYINTKTSMQAASPAFETARLFSLMGTGVKVATGLAYLIVFISALSIFISLFNALKQRTYDLAILRSMGASRGKIFTSIILEGIIISILGSLLGFTLGHTAMELVASSLEETTQVGITGKKFLRAEIYIFLGSLFVGFISSILPAINAVTLDISKILSKG